MFRYGHKIPGFSRAEILRIYNRQDWCLLSGNNISRRCRFFSDQVHSDLIGITVKDKYLQEALDAFKIKEPDAWSPSDWRKLYVNIRELRSSSAEADESNNRNIIYMAGKSILETWLNKGPKGKTLPTLFYEEIIETLSEDPICTREHAELGIHIVDHMISRNVMISHDILNMLFQLVLKQGDSILRYKYMCIAFSLAQKGGISLNPRRLKFAVRHLVQLHIATGELEGALFSLLRISNPNDWGGDKNVNVKLNYAVNEALLLALLSQGDVEYASTLLNHMHTHGNVYARTWGVFVSAAAEKYDHEALIWARNAAIIPGRVVVDDWTYMKMAEAASRNGDYRMTRWCLLRCKKRESVFPMISGNLRIIDQFMVPLIEAHAASGNIAKAFMFLERMKETCSSVRLGYVSELVKQLASSPEYIEIALLKFKQVCANPNTSDAVRTLMFNLICAGFIGSQKVLNSETLDPNSCTSASSSSSSFSVLSRSNWSQALVLYDGLLLNFDVKPNVDTMTLFLHYAITYNDHVLMERISSDCDSFGISKHTGPIAALVKAFSPSEGAETLAPLSQSEV